MSENPDHFFDEWRLYQAIIKHNYMRHHEMAHHLKLCIPGSQVTSTPRILELGCGDCHVVCESLDRNHPIEYVGVDLSKDALLEAEKKLAHTNWKKTLVHADISHPLDPFTSSHDKPFDLIIAGYSLHHLNNEQKDSAIHAAHRHLSPKGKLIIYDLMPKDTEARDQFLYRFLHDINHTWLEINVEQLKKIAQHVTENDFPIAYPTWKNLAQKAGFSSAKQLYRDPFSHYAFCVFSKS